MKHILTNIHRGLWISFTILLMVLAIIFTAAHLLAPYVVEQRSAVEQWTSAWLNQPVQIGSIEVTWKKLNPVIKCTQVEILNDAKSKVLLKVDELDTSIDIVRSFFRGHIQLGELTVNGAQLTAHQQADGSITLNGLGIINSKQSSVQEDNLDVYLDWLLYAPRISLQNINLNWYEADGNLLPIKNLALYLHNSAIKNTLRGEASLAQKVPSRLKFIVELHGDWRQKDKLKIRFYLQGQDILLSQWLAKHPISGFTATSGEADFKIWGAWAQNQWQSLQSLFSFKKIVLNKPNKSTLLISQGSGNILWQTQKNSWAIDAQFKDLAVSRWGKIPGFDNLTGSLHLTPTMGLAQISSQNVNADFGSLFRSKLFFEKLTSTAIWKKDAEGITIQATDTNIQTQDAAVNGDMNLFIPKDDSSPMISLLAGYQMVGRTHLLDYLPVGILSPTLIHWLDTSIIKSKFAKGTLVLQGPLHNFPFDHNEGRFIVDTQVSGVDLNYWQHWPPLRNIVGELVFAERRMEVNVNSATIFSTPVRQLHAFIPLLKKKVPAILQINGVLAGDSSDGIKFLRESPLSKGSMSVANDLEMQGPMQLQLQLSIPLEHDNSLLAVKGQVALQDDRLAIPTKNLQLHHLTGQINFTKDSLSSPRLTGTLWDKPIFISITTPETKPQFQFHYDDILGNLLPSANGWLLTLQSPTMDGQIVIPAEKQQAIQANFKRLYFTSGATKNFDQLKPSNLPKLNFVADDVRYGEKQLGQLQLQLTPIDNGVQITTLRFSSPAYNVQASGDWRGSANGSLTQLKGDFTSSNIAAALVSMGFPPSIKANQTTMRFNLFWPGAAYDPSLKDMSGNIVLQLLQGEIPNIGSETAAKMNIGRLLSILSFQSIERRLKLDFSDLTSHGFSFDTLDGNFQLQKGNAFTQNTTIKATVAQVAISGRIGLAAEDYDLQVSVTPHITSTLPLIVGLATGPVGPVAGAATWLASKLVGSAVDKIATDFYRMVGPWSDPKIEQSGNFFSEMPAAQK